MLKKAARGVQSCSMRDLEEVFAGLGRSDFRSRIRLKERERDYLKRKGMAVVLAHAADFIEKRLAPSAPANDGKQTPWRNHPVFVAQHATATCCRTCLEKWHGIPKGRELTEDERAYVVRVIERWLASEPDQTARDFPRVVEAKGDT
jgi:hypothetical protein